MQRSDAFEREDSAIILILLRFFFARLKCDVDDFRMEKHLINLVAGLTMSVKECEIKRN